MSRKFIAITGHMWHNADTGEGGTDFTPLPIADTLPEAMASGYQAAHETDDFLIAIVEDGVMIDARGASDMGPLTEWEPSELDELARVIGMTRPRR